jgi:hypothetical protein
MPKVCFDVSHDIADRVGVVREQLAAETGGSSSMDSTLRHLVLIGLDVLAKKPGGISMLFSPATKKARARLREKHPAELVDSEAECK